RHYYKNCFEFVFVARGSARFSVDGHTYPLSGGELFVTFPSEVHSSDSSPMVPQQMYWFQLEADDPGQLLYLNREAAGLLLEQLRSLKTRVIQMDPDQTASLLGAVFHDFCSDSPMRRMQGAQLLAFFLYSVLEYSESASFRMTPDIGRAVNAIMDHLQEELTLEELAREAALSVSRFKQKFKQQMGQSPRSFINCQKVEAAKRLLAEGVSVTETAMELGFSSSSYFSTVFRRYTTLSPSQFAESVSDERGQ
ncbi:MAG: AraC family transcriptional regulator, partial [Oscillospiraceae bacterium]|nr:AraC family transcriptional regulator [Oscillospiraceae bacterium]